MTTPKPLNIKNRSKMNKSDLEPMGEKYYLDKSVLDNFEDEKDPLYDEVFFGFLDFTLKTIFWYKTKEEAMKYKSLKYITFNFYFKKYMNPKPTLLSNFMMKDLNYDHNKWIWVSNKDGSYITLKEILLI